MRNAIAFTSATILGTIAIATVPVFDILSTVGLMK